MEKVPMKQMKSNIWKFKLIKAWMETIDYSCGSQVKQSQCYAVKRMVLDKRKSTRQYLNPIYATFLLFGHKTLIQLQDFIYYRKNSSG